MNATSRPRPTSSFAPRGGAPAGFARPDHGDRRGRGVSHLRRRGSGRHRFAPQPRGRRRLRHSLRRAERGRSDGDRRACRASRRAASEGGGGADRFSAASGRRRRGDRIGRTGERAKPRRPRTISGRCGRSASTTRSSSRRSRRNGRERARTRRRRASRKASPEAKPQANPHPSRRTSLPASRQGRSDDRESAEHPHRHGRPDGAGVPADLWPCARRARRTCSRSPSERRRVRQRLLQQPPLLALARLVHDGLLPSRTRVYDNAAEFPADIPTFAHHLRLRGYRTILSGKMHFCGPDQLHGFEERLTTDIYPADFGWTPDWDHPDERPSWYHNMSSVTEAGVVRAHQPARLRRRGRLRRRARDLRHRAVARPAAVPARRLVHPSARSVRRPAALLGSLSRRGHRARPRAGPARPRSIRIPGACAMSARWTPSR